MRRSSSPAPRKISPPLVCIFEDQRYQSLTVGEAVFRTPGVSAPSEGVAVGQGCASEAGLRLDMKRRRRSRERLRSGLVENVGLQCDMEPRVTWCYRALCAGRKCNSFTICMRPCQDMAYILLCACPSVVRLGDLARERRLGEKPQLDFVQTRCTGVHSEEHSHVCEARELSCQMHSGAKLLSRIGSS